MKKLTLPILLLLAVAALLAGCTSPGDQYSSVPQDRPANWEGQMPGMGSSPGSGVR
jgi:nitrous oxide reductase accessory protein NosL